MGLVDYWIKEADRFVLVTPFTPYDLPPDFCYGLSEEESNEALSDLYAELLERIDFAWHSIPEEERKNLPPFENFLKKIENEREEVISGSKTTDDIRDYYSKLTSQDLPSGLWHIYNRQHFYACIKFEHTGLKNQVEKRDMLSELKNSENSSLSKNHIKSKLSYSWYGTTSSSLHIVHSFKCNEETGRWLKSKKGFPDLLPFEDLAFYKGDKCMMGSITHERMIL